MPSALGPDLDAARDLIAFIDASPSPFHACETAAARLESAGFVRLRETDVWENLDRPWYVIRDGSLVAGGGVAGRIGPKATPFRIIGAHTDSPNLRIKPQPDTGRAGAGQLAIEVYGGVLLNSWLGRDLGLSGRLSMLDGTMRLVRVDRPVLHIPQLAIHLDREVSTVGLKLNPQQHLDPLWTVGPPEPGAFRSFLAKEADVDADAIAAWDVMVHDLTPGAVAGRDDEYVSASRLDNLCSAWAGTRAVVDACQLAAGDSGAVPVLVLFDHEEVGSSSSRGAASPLLPTVLERVVRGGGGDRESYHRALAGSVCASADMAHATHPNYAEFHEPCHWITINGGPVIKSNVNQRYATDARSAAAMLEACDRAGVPVQQYVHRNDLPCGSTIGPITASQLGISTVDVGAPQLAMHSARELMGSTDPALYAAALTAFLTPPPSPVD